MSVNKAGLLAISSEIAIKDLTRCCKKHFTAVFCCELSKRYFKVGEDCEEARKSISNRKFMGFIRRRRKAIGEFSARDALKL
jgi:hypothetical protein